MSVLLPDLVEGRIYSASEVEQYIGEQDGTSDYDLIVNQFPRSLDSSDIDFDNWQDGDEVLLRYELPPVQIFDEQLVIFRQRTSSSPSDRARVHAILDRLKAGECALPVFIQHNDPRQRILEGTHRIVAWSEIGLNPVPVFVAGYRNWFSE